MIDPAPMPPVSPVARLVLASGSPRRRLMLAMAGFDFDVVTPHVDETPRPGEEPEAMVLRLAVAKADAVAGIVGPGSWVLGCDTTVVRDRHIVGKPATAEEGVEMLLSLAGRSHQVVTGYAVIGGQVEPVAGVALSQVTMRHIAPGEATAYVASGEPMDKAGAYALQGEGGRFVTRVDGSRSNVVGLPLEAVVPVLRARGIPQRSGGVAGW